MNIDAERLQDPETIRLHMGELTASEMRVAQAAIRYALAGVQGERGWLPIESAPRDGTPVLVYSAIGNPRTMEGVCIAEFWEADQIDDGREWWRVTHDSETTYVFCPWVWMPLPQPPRTAWNTRHEAEK